MTSHLARSVVTPEIGFTLHPLKFALGVTMETVWLPDDIAGKLEGKSSLARTGLLIHVTGGFVDPGFHGPLTLEFFNAREIPDHPASGDSDRTDRLQPDGQQGPQAVPFGPLPERHNR
jgi:deoxycytidine triphosphate deaminase